MAASRDFDRGASLFWKPCRPTGCYNFQRLSDHQSSAQDSHPLYIRGGLIHDRKLLVVSSVRGLEVLMQWPKVPHRIQLFLHARIFEILFSKYGKSSLSDE